MEKTITFKMMVDRFSSRYPGLASKVVYCHQDDGLNIHFYFSDGMRMIYDYIRNEIISVDGGCPVDADEELEAIREEYRFVMDEYEWKEEFSKSVRWEMQQLGITQKELSERTGIHINTLSRYISGERIPSAYTLSKIAVGLNCSISKIMRFYPDRL